MGGGVMYLKVLDTNHQSCHGGEFDWSPYLPQGDKPGTWLPEIVDPVICERGWHWCDEASLMKWWAVANMRVYEAEPRTDVSTDHDDGKTVSGGGRLLRAYALPEWWQGAMRFVAEDIPSIPWMHNDGQPLETWRVFPSWAAAMYAARDAARDAARIAATDAAMYAARIAARDAARDAVRDAAGDAVRDAARIAARDVAMDAGWDVAMDAGFYQQVIHICGDLDIDESHRQHARDRWQVWQKGYGLYCELGGTLYTYEAGS